MDSSPGSGRSCCQYLQRGEGTLSSLDINAYFLAAVCIWLRPRARLLICTMKGARLPRCDTNLMFAIPLLLVQQKVMHSVHMARPRVGIIGFAFHPTCDHHTEPAAVHYRWTFAPFTSYPWKPAVTHLPRSRHAD